MYEIRFVEKINKLKKINRDKHKDFDSYLSNKLDLLERVYDLLCDIIEEIEYKIDMIRRDLIYRDMYKMDIDELHLINSKLNEIMRRSKKDLRNIISLDELQQKQQVRTYYLVLLQQNINDKF